MSGDAKDLGQAPSKTTKLSYAVGFGISTAGSIHSSFKIR